MLTIIIPLAVIAVLLLVIIGAGFYIKSRLSKLSRDAFGTEDFIEGYKEQKRKLSETPRSVHGMTGIYLPQILQDFPEFDAELYKNKAEAVLRGYFNAIATGSTDTLPEETAQTLKNHIREIIENLRENNQKQYFSEPVIHDTQIARYIKDGATVTIVYNISVGLYSYIEDESGKVIHGEKNEKHQAIYDVGLVYVQDADKLGHFNEGFGLNCPNCGAPVKNLGLKFCEYCGSGLIEVNARVWRFNSVKEQSVGRKPY